LAEVEVNKLERRKQQRWAQRRQFLKLAAAGAWNWLCRITRLVWDSVDQTEAAGAWTKGTPPSIKFSTKGWVALLIVLVLLFGLQSCGTSWARALRTFIDRGPPTQLNGEVPTRRLRDVREDLPSVPSLLG
jgi:hypothetical protein